MYRTRTNAARNRRARLLRTLQLVAAAVLAWLVVITMVTTVAGAADNLSSQNHPAYWEQHLRDTGYPDASCDKTEDALQGPRWYSDADYLLVVAKAGQSRISVWDVQRDDAIVTEQDISHIIRCTGTLPPATTTTEEPPVVTVPPIDICHEDEPCWNCNTMGNMVCGPSTTTTSSTTTSAPVTHEVSSSRPATPVPVPVTSIQFTG